MPTTRANSRARDDIFSQLKADHKRVKRAYREFAKLDVAADPLRCEAIVGEVLALLQVHTALEEELVYPAARSACGEAAIDVAEVEHAAVAPLMRQLQAMNADDPKFAARFAVLCEHLLRHAKHEENVLFRKMRRARLDWAGLQQRVATRRTELAAGAKDDPAPGDEEDDSADIPLAVASSRPEQADPPARRRSGRPDATVATEATQAADAAALPSDAHTPAAPRAAARAAVRPRRRRPPAVPDNGIVRVDGATSRKI